MGRERVAKQNRRGASHFLTKHKYSNWIHDLNKHSEV